MNTLTGKVGERCPLPQACCWPGATTHPLQEEECKHGAEGEEASHRHHDDRHGQVLMQRGQGCDPATTEGGGSRTACSGSGPWSLPARGSSPRGCRVLPTTQADRPRTARTESLGHVRCGRDVAAAPRQEQGFGETWKAWLLTPGPTLSKAELLAHPLHSS